MTCPREFWLPNTQRELLAVAIPTDAVYSATNFRTILPQLLMDMGISMSMLFLSHTSAPLRKTDQ